MWLDRNDRVFNSNSQPRFSVDKLVAICLQRAWEFFLIVGPSTTSRASVPIWVRWTPPIPGWIKLNTDGSSNGNPGPAGGGGVICDHEWNWLWGFMRHIGSASSVMAELWALRDGLSLVIDMDFLNVLIEIDAFIVVSFFATNAPRHPCLSSLSMTAGIYCRGSLRTSLSMCLEKQISVLIALLIWVEPRRRILLCLIPL